MTRNRIILMMIGFLFVFLGYSSDGKTEEWINYGSSERGSWYYHKNTITPVSNKGIQVLDKVKYSTVWKNKYILFRKNNNLSTEGYDKFDYDITVCEVNCKNNTYKLIKTIDYNEKNEILYVDNYPNPKIFQVKPGSMVYLLLKSVCPK